MSIALVTGATGFIGSHLVRRLLHEGVAVHVLCRDISHFWRVTDLLGRFHIHTICLNDRAGLADLVQAVRPHQIFHLASATVVAGATAPSTELVKTNLLGTINLIDACDSVDYQSLVCTGDCSNMRRVRSRYESREYVSLRACTGSPNLRQPFTPKRNPSNGRLSH